MVRSLPLFAALCAVMSLIVVSSGCQKPAANPDKNKEAEHAHPTEGPHKGSLIELGNEEYHAELVHDDKAGKVTIYVLDGEAKKTVPIEAKEITINLKHDGKAEQFKLAAAPDKGDPEGQSSRFVSEEKELAEDLDAKDAHAEVALTIKGKGFSGKVKHDHDHK